MKTKNCIPGVIAGVILSVIGLMLFTASINDSNYAILAFIYFTVGITQVTSYSIKKLKLALITSWLSIIHSFSLIIGWIVYTFIASKMDNWPLAIVILIFLVSMLVGSGSSVYFQKKSKII